MSDDSKDEAEKEQRSLDSIIESWLKKYGEEKETSAHVPYWKISSQDYKDTMSSLLNTILYEGYAESDARSAVLLSKIQNVLTAEIKDSKKLSAWKNIISDTWKWVIANHFADETIIKPATNYEAQAKAKAEVKAKEREEKENAPPDPYVRPGRKLDPENFEGYGDAEVIYDEDVAKMFEDLKKDD